MKNLSIILIVSLVILLSINVTVFAQGKVGADVEVIKTSSGDDLYKALPQFGPVTTLRTIYEPEAGVNAKTGNTIFFQSGFEESWTWGAPPGWTFTPAANANNSWHRNDFTTGWTSISGSYSPVSYMGGFSARFHSYDATAGLIGTMTTPNINLSTATDSVFISFWWTNTSGTDTLFIDFSTDGGANFVNIGFVLVTGGPWYRAFGYIPSTSSTTQIRFRARSDYGLNDIGLDEVIVYQKGPAYSGALTLPGTFSSFTDLARRLTIYGVSGPTTISVTAGTYLDSVTFPPIPGASETNTITIVNTDGPVTVQRGGVMNHGTTVGSYTQRIDDATISLWGTDYITFDGIGISDKPGDINNEWGYHVRAFTPIDGANYNIIKNCLIVMNKTNTATRGIRHFPFWTLTAQTGSSSYNKYYNNDIRSCGWQGILLQGNPGAPLLDLMNEIASVEGGTARIFDIGGGTGSANAISISGQNGVKVYGLDIDSIWATSGPVNAILLGTGTTAGDSVVNFEIYNNQIRRLVQTAGTASTILTGIRVPGHTNALRGRIYNNFVSNLRSNGTHASDAVLAFYHQGGAATFVDWYFNTVLVNNMVIGTNGGSSVFRVDGGTATIRNNVLVNLSAQSGTGKNYVYRRTGGTIISSNNALYIDTVLTNRFIGFYTTDRRSLPAWQSAVPGLDVSSVYENPNFVNSTILPYNLHINSTIPTRLESGGTNIPGITTDYDGDIRAVASKINNNVAPDIGADEFNGIPIDELGPAITYTPLPNTHLTTNRTLTTNIRDIVSGVNEAAGFQPRLYYKKGALGVYYIDSAGTKVGNDWTFTFDHSLLGGVGVGDTIFYYVAASDSSNNVSTNPSGGSGLTPPGNVPPTTLNIYRILPSMSGTYTIGIGGNYANIKAFFDAINGAVVTGHITGNIISDISETATASLNPIYEDIPGSNYLITIQPFESARLVSGSIAGALIDLNGADRITFNGEISGVKSLTLRNTSTTGQTFVLRNGAEFNTITNCIIEGANTSATSGTIVFSTSTAAVGNRNNNILNNDIRDRSDAAGVPANAIYSSGTAGALNASNTISGNNIFNWTNAGILLVSAGLGDGWVINSNSLYQTASRTTALTGISVGGGSGHTISGNSIGGSAPDRSGSPLTTSAAFTGISLAVGTASPTSVQGNTISNIVSTASSACKVISVTSGNVNIGTVTGNIIGGGVAAYDTLNFAYDNDAISSSSGGLVNIENNIISNIRYHKVTPGGDRTCGIFVSGAGTHSIKNNEIRNLSSNSTGTAYTFLPVGIHLSSTGNGHNVEGNKIYNIAQTNTGTSAYTCVGIYVASVASTPAVTHIRRNYVYNLTSAGTGTGTSSPLIHGIYSASGSATYSNNMIALGTGVGNEVRIDGIRDVGSGVNNWYYNSVRIVGTTAGTVNRSYAFNRSGTATVTLRNNIFSNVRTGGGGNLAIANTNAAATGWAPGASNYNVFDGLSTALAQWLSTGSLTGLADWQINSSGDLNTVVGDPGFVSDVDLHILPTSAIPNNNALPLVGIVDVDFDGELRSTTTPDRGADEFTGVPPAAFSLLTPANGATSVPLNGDLTWEVSQYAQNYDVYLDKVNATTLVSENQTGTIYSYTNLDPNSVYYWKVIAKNANGTTQATGSPWSFTTVSLLPPNPPSDLTISNITTNAMDLSWTDNSMDEDGFNIYKSTDGSIFTLVDAVTANITSYTGDATRSLSPNTRYWWRVTAYNANGESAPTSANAFTLANTPGAPLLSEPTAASMMVTLVTAGNPAATEFVVRVVYGTTTKYMNTAGALVDVPIWGTFSAFGGSGGRILTGLLPATIYTIDVKARNSNNIETVFGPSSSLSTLSYPSTLSEDFATYTGFAPPPVGWNEGDQKNILDTGAPFGSFSNGGWINDFFGNTGTNRSARFNFFGTTSDDYDWILSPFLSLTDKKASRLLFDIALTPWTGTSPTTLPSNDTMFVVISTDGGNTFTRANVVAAYHAGTPISNIGQTENISLAAYEGQTNVRIGFYAKDLMGAGDVKFFIDNVRIEAIVAKDIQVLSVSLAPGPPYYVGTPITVSALIRNNGTESNPTSVPLTYKVGSAPSTYSDGIGEVFTPAWVGNTATVSFTTQYTPGATGDLTMFVRSFYPGDQVPANDIASRAIKVLPPGALFEDWTDVNALLKWKVVNNDGGTKTWRRATEKFLSSPASAGSDFESATLRNDDWLITPKLSVVAGDSFTFWHSARSTIYPESLYVRLSTVGNDPSDPWVDLLKIRDATVDWKYKAIDLTPWAGQNVWIAFVNRGLDQWTIYVDDITGPALYIPYYDLALTDFYQSSGIPTPKIDMISDQEAWMMNQTLEDKPIATLADRGIVELSESEISKTVVYAGNSSSSLDKKLNPIGVKAIIKNVGRNPVAYTLNWNVSGASQPAYNGPSVDSGATHIADLTFNPTTRGTFLTTGAITVTGDENPDNNTDFFRMRVYPDNFARTIYDRGDNVVDTWVGWGSATRPMKAGVRFTAPQTMRLAGVDFIYNTGTVTSGDIIVTVRGAGDSLTGPGPVLYSKIFNAADYFTGAGDYVTFPFDENAPVIAGGSDYWITIKMPAGILYPGAVHNTGFTPGRSFYEGAVDIDTTKWYPLVITTERAWIMRSYFVAPPNSIAGVKFNDLNGNGQKDPDEPGLEGWYINLNGPVNGEKITGPDGSYFFGDLPDGEYTITENQQVGWIQTMPATPNYYIVFVSGGQNVTDKNFGNFKLGKISGYKWEDINGDGVWNAGEPPVHNWQINLTGPVSGSTFTDINGLYMFENLTAGLYTVSENISAGWFFTYPTPNQHTVNISSGTVISGNAGVAEVPNFGNSRYGSVSGLKFWDRNNNGVKDPNEVGLANWTIFLTGNNPPTRSTITNSNGEFLFENVVPDNYVLTEELKPGWTMTTSPAPFVVVSGSIVTDKLFGNFRNVDATKYRSFRPEDLVALDPKDKVPKAVKRKPIGAYWEFMIINPKPYPLTLLNIQFKNDVRQIVEAGEFNISGAKKAFMLSDAELAPGDTVIVKGYSTKGKPQEIKKLWYGPKTTIPATNILPAFQYLELPLPTWRNMIDEIFAEGGFADDGGLLVGQKGDPKQTGWVFITKPGDVVKSLYYKGMHTAGPKFFRKFDNNKPFLKEQKSLPPAKQNNILFAEIVAAKLAIAASKLEKIPVGYGDLIYIDDDIAWHPFNEMTVEEIVNTISDAMNTFEGDSADYYRIMRKLNTAFAGPIDTVEFATRTVLKGVRPLAEIPYLFADPDGKVSKIEPKPIVYNERPSTFELSQNYPNPFNPSTTIEFTLPEDAVVTLKIYNILGQEVATLIDNELYTEGLNEVEFDAGKLSSGVYFYRLIAETLGDNPMKYSQIKKMVLMK